MTTKTSNYSFSGDYHALVWKEGKWFVARCVEVELASQGKTKSEALTNLKEALELLLEDKGKERIKPPALDKLELHHLAC